MQIDPAVQDFCREFSIQKRHMPIIQYIMEGYSYTEISELINMGPRYANDYMKKFMQHRGFKGRYHVMSEIYKKSLG